MAENKSLLESGLQESFRDFVASNIRTAERVQLYDIGGQKFTIRQIMQLKKAKDEESKAKVKAIRRLKEAISDPYLSPSPVELTTTRLTTVVMDQHRDMFESWALKEGSRVPAYPQFAIESTPEYKTVYKAYLPMSKQGPDGKVSITREQIILYSGQAVRPVYFPTYKVYPRDYVVERAVRRQEFIAKQANLPDLFLIKKFDEIAKSSYYGTVGFEAQMNRLKKNLLVSQVSDDIYFPQITSIGMYSVQKEQLTLSEYCKMLDVIFPLCDRPIRMMATFPTSFKLSYLDLLYGRGPAPNAYRKKFAKSYFPLAAGVTVAGELKEQSERDGINYALYENEKYILDKDAFHVWGLNPTSDAGFPFNKPCKEVGVELTALADYMMNELSRCSNLAAVEQFMESFDFRRLTKMVPKPEVYEVTDDPATDKRNLNRNIFGASTFFYIPGHVVMNVAKRQTRPFPHSFTLFKFVITGGGLNQLFEDIQNSRQSLAPIKTIDADIRQRLVQSIIPHYIGLTYADNQYFIGVRLKDPLEIRREVNREIEKAKLDENDPRLAEKEREIKNQVMSRSAKYDWFSLDMSSHESSHKARDIFYECWRMANCAFNMPLPSQMAAENLIADMETSSKKQRKISAPGLQMVDFTWNQGIEGDATQKQKQASERRKKQKEQQGIQSAARDLAVVQGKVLTAGLDYELYMKYLFPQTILNSACVIGNSQLKVPGMPSGVPITFHANTSLSAIPAYCIMKKLNPIDHPIGVEGKIDKLISDIYKTAGMKVKLELQVNDLFSQFEMRPMLDEDGIVVGYISKVVQLDLLGFDAVKLSIKNLSGLHTSYIAVLNETRLIKSLLYSKVAAKKGIAEDQYHIFETICRWAKYKALYVMGGWVYPEIAELLKFLLLEVDLQLKSLKELGSVELTKIFKELVSTSLITDETADGLADTLRVQLTSDPFPHMSEVVRIMCSPEFNEQFHQAAVETDYWRKAYPASAFIKEEQEKVEQTEGAEDIELEQEVDVESKSVAAHKKLPLTAGVPTGRYIKAKPMKTVQSRFEEYGQPSFFPKRPAPLALNDAKFKEAMTQVKAKVLEWAKLSPEERPYLALPRLFYHGSKEEAPKGSIPISEYKDLSEHKGVQFSLWCTALAENILKLRKDNATAVVRALTQGESADIEFKHAWNELMATGSTSLSATNPLSGKEEVETTEH